MRLIGNNRQLGAALRISIGKIPNTLGRAFWQSLNSFASLLINHRGKKVLYLVGVWNGFLADMATYAANLTVLAHQGAFIMTITKHMDSRLKRRHADNIAWTDRNALTTTGAFFAADDRQTISSHFNGIERTGPLTGAEAETTAGASFRPISYPLRCGAVFQSQVTVFELRLAIITLAEDHGNFTGCSRSLDTEDLCQLHHHICATGGTLVQINATSDESLGITSTPRKATGATIGPRQDFNDCKLSWVDINSEFFGG